MFMLKSTHERIVAELREELRVANEKLDASKSKVKANHVTVDAMVHHLNALNTIMDRIGIGWHASCEYVEDDDHDYSMKCKSRQEAEEIAEKLNSGELSPEGFKWEVYCPF